MAGTEKAGRLHQLRLPGSPRALLCRAGALAGRGATSDSPQRPGQPRDEPGVPPSPPASKPDGHESPRLVHSPVLERSAFCDFPFRGEGIRTSSEPPKAIARAGYEASAQVTPEMLSSVGRGRFEGEPPHGSPPLMRQNLVWPGSDDASSAPFD